MKCQWFLPFQKTIHESPKTLGGGGFGAFSLEANRSENDLAASFSELPEVAEWRVARFLYHATFQGVAKRVVPLPPPRPPREGQSRFSAR